MSQPDQLPLTPSDREKQPEKNAVAILGQVLQEKQKKGHQVPEGNFSSLLKIPGFLSLSEQEAIGNAMRRELTQAGKIIPGRSVAEIGQQYGDWLQEKALAKKAAEQAQAAATSRDQIATLANLGKIPPPPPPITLPYQPPVEAAVPPNLEARRQEDLIKEALASGRSALFTRSNEGENKGLSMASGLQTVLEVNHNGPRSDYLRAFSGLRDLLYIPQYGEEPTNKIRQDLGRLGVHEVFGVVPPQNRDIMQDVPIQKGGLFGFGAKTEMQSQKVGQRPETMDDYLGNGDTNPACKIYYVVDSAGDHNIEILDQYRHNGRPGQNLTVEFILPTNLAQQIATEVQRDPTLARKLTDAFINAKYTSSFQKDWAAEGRPPYNNWDKYGPPKMYFLNLLTNQNVPRGIDPKNVITYKPTS